MKRIQQITLQDVATIDRDIVEPSRIKSGTLFVGLENIDSGGRFVGVRPVDSGELASSKFAFTRRHVLYGKLRPYLAKIARPDFDGICSTDILPVLPGPEIDRGYLTWLLLTPQMVSLAASRATGANLPRLSPTALAEMKIPLPPLPEQLRISEILDKADTLRAKRRAAFAQLDTLTQSIFLDMFGDPATNPKGWPVKRFEDEITSVRYGTGSPPLYVDDGVPFIRATNIKAGTISPKDLKRITPADAARLDKCRVRAGNLIIVRSGVNTGDCAVVPSEYDSACAAFDLIVELPRANAVFYNFLINSPHGKAHLEPLTRRAAQSHLNAEQVRSLRFISPDESAKWRFAALVDSINSQKARGDVNLRELDALFGALQHAAFRGEL